MYSSSSNNNGIKKAMKQFDHVVELSGVKFLCFGTIAPDGLAEIDMVRLEDSKINIWPAVRQSRIGIVLEDACDLYLVELEELPNAD